MDDADATRAGVDLPQETTANAPESMLGDVEQLIEQIGTRYIDDLRMLSAQFKRLYEAQLAAKDERIAVLQSQLRSMEQERAVLEERLEELQQTGKQYVANLHALSDDLRRHIESTARASATPAQDR
jgi:chromosome segregation ATPase